jgi:hypothetical protein
VKTRFTASRRILYQKIPLPSRRKFIENQPDDIRGCNNGQSHRTYWENTRLREYGLGNLDWQREEEGSGAGSTMSVTVWPKRQAVSPFLDVPELLCPIVFGAGSLCLGYEERVHGPWNLVVRRISDWHWVAEILAFKGQPYVLGHDSDLIILYSWDEGKIQIWNPLLDKLCEPQHPHGMFFAPLKILESEKGFITTVRASFDDVFKDVCVAIWRDITWKGARKSPSMELRTYRLPLLSLFPEISRSSQSFDSLQLFTRIHEVGLNGILFHSPMVGSLAMTYSGKPLAPTDLDRGMLVGEFSDGTRVIHCETRHTGAFRPFQIKMTKNGETISQFETDDDYYCSSLIFQDTYLVVLDRHLDNRSSPCRPCRFTIRTKVGGLIYEARLGPQYLTYKPRIFEEAYSIVVCANDLSEALVWDFGEAGQVPLRGTKRVKENFRQRYNLRSKARRLF